MRTLCVKCYVYSSYDKRLSAFTAKFIEGEHNLHAFFNKLHSCANAAYATSQLIIHRPTCESHIVVLTFKYPSKHETLA